MRRSILMGAGGLALVATLFAAGDAIGQMRWSLRTLLAYPAATANHSMAYDSARRVVVLTAPSSRYECETWEWSGVDWIRCWPKNSLPPGAFTLAYDAARGRTVAFSGGTPVPLTYEWDGFGWNKRSPKTSPPPRGYTAMAYDPGRRRVVLFGGYHYSGMAFNDTWEWDGTDWALKPSVQSPPARYRHAMATDTARGRVVLFGGMAVNELNDTWVWHGTTWLRKSSTLNPSPRAGAMMAFDASRGRIVLFGGQQGLTGLGDTWEWDGRAWTQPTLAASPGPRWSGAGAYHAATQRMLVHGGNVSAGNGGVSRDTWEYGGVHLAVTGTPRPGNPMGLTLAAAADAGRSYQLASSFYRGTFLLGNLVVGLYMDELLWASASDALPTTFRHYRGVLDGQGQATASILIPGLTALVGKSIHTAFVTIDAKAKPPYRSVSNTVTFLITP